MEQILAVMSNVHIPYIINSSIHDEKPEKTIWREIGLLLHQKVIHVTDPNGQ